MKAMPFRVADGASVTVQVPTARVAGVTYTPDQPVDNWDYLSELQVVTSVKVDEDVFRRQTGLTGPAELKRVDVLIQADCQSAGSRHTARIPIEMALNTPGSIELNIAPGTVASQLDVTVSIVLVQPDSAPRHDRTAHLCGSRLFETPESWRFGLEGGGASFPTEAVAFAALGLPRQAPWHLHIEPDPKLPFLAAVRLLINTEHPVAKEVLEAGRGGMATILFHDVLLQMLLAVASVEAADLNDTDQDSLGTILEAQCQTYLGHSLIEALSVLRDQPWELMSRLKDGTGFALEGAR